MTLVVDASAVVASLIDSGRKGEWARAALGDDQLVAPQSMPAEVANALRRAILSGDLTDTEATAALADLLQLRVELHPFEPVAARAWELRANLTVHDAWYVALAESLDADLATIDLRLVSSPGPRCAFATPEG